MSLFIVGGDNLGKIHKKMGNLGFDEIEHLTGRKRSSYRDFQLPVNIDMILILTDYVNHNLMNLVKKEARKKDIDIVYARRSWASIYKNLEGYKNSL